MEFRGLNHRSWMKNLMKFSKSMTRTTPILIDYSIFREWSIVPLPREKIWGQNRIRIEKFDEVFVFRDPNNFYFDISFNVPGKVNFTYFKKKNFEIWRPTWGRMKHLVQFSNSVIQETHTSVFLQFSK